MYIWSSPRDCEEGAAPSIELAEANLDRLTHWPIVDSETRFSPDGGIIFYYPDEETADADDDGAFTPQIALVC